MAFWWPLLVLAFAYGICRFLLMLIPPKVPSIDVDTSDGTLSLSTYLSIYCTHTQGGLSWRWNCDNDSVGRWKPSAGEQFHICEFSLSLLWFTNRIWKNLANRCMIWYCCAFNCIFSQSLWFVIGSNPGTSEGNIAAIRQDSSVLRACNYEIFGICSCIDAWWGQWASARALVTVG